MPVARNNNGSAKQSLTERLTQSFRDLYMDRSSMRPLEWRHLILADPGLAASIRLAEFSKAIHEIVELVMDKKLFAADPTCIEEEEIATDLLWLGAFHIRCSDEDLINSLFDRLRDAVTII